MSITRCRASLWTADKAASGEQLESPMPNQDGTTLTGLWTDGRRRCDYRVSDFVLPLPQSKRKMAVRRIE